MDNPRKGELLLPRLASIADPSGLAGRPLSPGQRVYQAVAGTCRVLAELARGVVRGASRALTVFPVLELLGLAGLLLLLAR